MKTYLVTGGTSGIGLGIVNSLLLKGNKVYAVGRNFDNLKDGQNLIKIKADIRNLDEIKRVVSLVSEEKLDGLVNSAGVAFYGIHESLSAEQVSDMCDVNIKAPMVITNALLPKIREAEGIIVNISSVTAKHYDNTHGVAYGATKTALTSFGESLFEEIRKQNVRVVNIHPDLTDTNLYRNADFKVTGEPFETLFAEDIASAVNFAIEAREGLCVTDITVRPQKNKIVKKSKGES